MPYTKLKYVDTTSTTNLNDYIHKSYVLDLPLSHTRLTNATLLPPKVINGALYGCVYTEKGELMPQSKYNEAFVGYYDHGEPVDSNEKVIMSIFTYSVWGHLLTDALKRLWFLFTPECQDLVKQGYKLVIMYDHDFRSKSNARRLFELLNINIDDFITVNQPTRFAEVVLPDLSITYRDNMYYYTKEYVQVVEKIKANIKPSLNTFNHHNKIYLTRCRLKSAVNCRDYGEKRIETLFAKAGYQVVAPEEYDLDTQISIMMNANTVVATEGSIAHNILFARPNTQLIILRKANYVNDFQIMINEAANVTVTYIDVFHSPLINKVAPWAGPFYLYPSQHLINYLGLKGNKKTPALDPLYYRYIIDNDPKYTKAKNIISVFKMSPTEIKRFLVNKLRNMYLKMI